MKRQIIISFLPETNHQVANFYGVGALQFSQVLFGKAAQVNAFITIAAEERKEVVFCHRPELICSQRSKDYFQNAASAIRIHDWDTIDHYRFDAPKNVRLLKGANNIVVSSYAQTRETLALSPAAQVMDYYPAGTRRLLTYTDADASTHALPDGQTLSVDILSDDYVTADLNRDLAALGEEVSLPELLRTGAIQAFSFAELVDAQPHWARAGYSFHGQGDFENAFVRAATRDRVHRSDSDLGAFTLIPLNLDDDGQTLETLISTIFSAMPTRDNDSPVCVAPFNINLLNYARLKRLVESCAKASGSPSLLRRFFLFFLRDKAAAPFLGRLFGTAIIDGSDPDGLWNVKRLRHIGIPSIVLTNSFNTQSWEKRSASARVFRTGYQSASEIEDWYGKRVIVSDAPSSKETADLMAMIEMRPHHPPEPIAPAAPAVRDQLREAAFS